MEEAVETSSDVVLAGKGPRDCLHAFREHGVHNVRPVLEVYSALSALPVLALTWTLLGKVRTPNPPAGVADDGRDTGPPSTPWGPGCWSEALPPDRDPSAPIVQGIEAIPRGRDPEVLRNPKPE